MIRRFALDLPGAAAALPFAAPPACAPQSARKPKAGRDVAGVRDEDVTQFAQYIRAHGPAPVDGTWGFWEYVDLVEAAWRLKSALPEAAQPFAVVGLSAGAWGSWKGPSRLRAAGR